MKTLFLIDAYAIIYRAYYALLNNARFTNKAGLNTAPVFGFVNTLHEVISKESPTHLAVAFDTGKTFRHETYPEYKAQREKTPEDISAAIPFIKRIIQAYGIPVIEAPGYEADDIIASMAAKAETEGFDTYMLTPDKDYCQLVDEHCFIYRPRHGGGYEVMGVEEVKQKYSLESPAQMVDYLGLVGDKSDNVPGCPGVGDKTAVALLSKYGSVEGVLANVGEIKGALQSKIAENKEQIELSKFLVQIKRDVPLDVNIDDLSLQTPDLQELNKVFEELDMKGQARKINAFYNASSTQAQPKTVSLFDDAEFGPQNQTQAPIGFEFVEFQTLRDYPHNFTILLSKAQIDDFLNQLSQQSEFCFDTETSDLDVHTAELLGISFCWKAAEAYYLPLNNTNRAEMLDKLRPIFENESSLKIAHNIKFDLSVLKVNGVEVRGRFFDCMIAHYLLQPETRHGMDHLAEVYFNYKTITYSDIAGTGKKQKSLKDVDVAIVGEYSCEDAEITYRLKGELKPQIEAAGLTDLFYNVEIPLVDCLADMELAGVRIDTAALKTLSEQLRQQAYEIESKIFEYAGGEFNVSSPKQVGELLFDKLQLSGKARKTRKGQYSTSEEVLETLRSKHPVVGLLLDSRKVKKLLNTYVDALPELVNPVTGKIHTSFNQSVTATGRLSSTNPNLQNIPVREDIGREIRQAFIPDDGCIFLSADYSQIELRLMAHLSGDEHMVAAFNSGEDIHAATAAKIYKLDIKDVTKDMRRKAKTANFGIIYGITAFGLAERLGISRVEAKELIDGYFESYPQVKNYIDQCIETARANGYAETILHRKRYLPDINSANSTVRGFAERNAVNAPIQGSAADIIKIAMVRIHSKMRELGLRSQMILQVHDELDFNVFPDELETVKQVVKDGMENAVKLSVPLIADVGTGSNWLESH